MKAHISLWLCGLSQLAGVALLSLGRYFALGGCHVPLEAVGRGPCEPRPGTPVASSSSRSSLALAPPSGAQMWACVTVTCGCFVKCWMPGWEAASLWEEVPGCSRLPCPSGRHAESVA